MRYKYAKQRMITLTKKSYIYWNGHTDYVYIYDDAIHRYTEWVTFNNAKLSIKKFEELKKNGLIEQFYVNAPRDSYWRFTAKALAMDDIILYAPYVRRNTEASNG